MNIAVNEGMNVAVNELVNIAMNALMNLSLFQQCHGSKLVYSTSMCCHTHQPTL